MHFRSRTPVSFSVPFQKLFKSKVLKKVGKEIAGMSVEKVEEERVGSFSFRGHIWSHQTLHWELNRRRGKKRAVDGMQPFGWPCGRRREEGRRQVDIWPLCYCEFQILWLSPTLNLLELLIWGFLRQFAHSRWRRFELTSPWPSFLSTLTLNTQTHTHTDTHTHTQEGCRIPC